MLLSVGLPPKFALLVVAKRVCPQKTTGPLGTRYLSLAHATLRLNDPISWSGRSDRLPFTTRVLIPT